GARVAVIDVDGPRAEQTAQEIRDAGGEALAVPTEVADAASVGKMAELVHDGCGSDHRRRPQRWIAAQVRIAMAYPRDFKTISPHADSITSKSLQCVRCCFIGTVRSA